MRFMLLDALPITLWFIHSELVPCLLISGWRITFSYQPPINRPHVAELPARGAASPIQVARVDSKYYYVLDTVSHMLLITANIKKNSRMLEMKMKILLPPATVNI